MTSRRDRKTSSQTCPRCWTPYRPGAERCVRCGFELQKEESLSFIDLFGPPQVLRRYSIQETLSESRVGHVYKALDRETETICVIKELSGAALLDPLEAERAGGRLRRLVRQLSQLKHPNLVRVHSLLSEGNRHFVVMDLVDGPTLQMVLDEREEPIPEPVALHWGARLCDALSHLHHLDPPVFFSDLTARHIMLNSSSQPVLIDLGLSRLFQSKQRKNEGVAGDIGALGALLYHVLTSREPPAGRYQPLRQLNPLVSDPLAQAIHRAMSRSVEERFPCMADFRNALQARDRAPEEFIGILPETAPFELVSGRQALTLKHLVEAVLAGGPEDAEAVLDRFLDGQVTTWLKEMSEGLREAGQNRIADEMIASAQSAEQLRSRVMEATTVQQKAAFHKWLFATGYGWGQPELAVGTFHLRLGAVRGELRMGAIFGIENRGSGYLVGEVTSLVDWLRVVENEFACRGGQEAQITAELSDRRHG
jgi:tRNA A-37 threonylcarbamoyl transferase component Bud32